MFGGPGGMDVYFANYVDQSICGPIKTGHGTTASL